MTVVAQGSTVWVTLAEFTPAALSPVPSWPRCCTVPPGSVLPLSVPEFAAIQNRTLLERERCGVCGGRGVCWHGQCWLCSGCASGDDFCDDKMCWN